MWEDLVLGAWRTRLDGVATAQGEVAGKGHHGRYRVTAMLGGKQTSGELELKPGGGTVVLQIKP